MQWERMRIPWHHLASREAAAEVPGEVAATGTVLAVLLLLGGCCLSTSIEGSTGGNASGAQAIAGAGATTGEQATTGGGTTGTGGGTSGGTTASSGTGSTTGGDAGVHGDCADTYCAPNFLCDPTDGVCRCGGQDCEGECQAGTCVLTCPLDAGGGPVVILGGANAIWLPIAVVGSPYIYQFKADCYSASNLTWDGFLPFRLGLELTRGGTLAGKPQQPTDNGPFEFQMQVMINGSGAGVQNYLLEIVDPDGGS
jgi:hypothetical protein